MATLKSANIPLEEKIEIIKDYLKSEDGLEEYSNKKRIPYLMLIEWLFDPVIIKQIFGEKFEINSLLQNGLKESKVRDYLEKLENNGIIKRIYVVEGKKSANIPLEEKIEIIKDYLKSEDGLEEYSNKKRIPYLMLIEWLFDPVIIKQIFGEIFNEKYLIEAGFNKRKINDILEVLIKRGLIYEMERNYTFNRELAEVYLHVSKNKRKKKSKKKEIHIAHQTALWTIELDSDVILEPSTKQYRKVKKTKSISPKKTMLTNEKITYEIIKILNIGNIKPDNAFEYKKEVEKKMFSIKEYVETYEKYLFPLSYKLFEGIIKNGMIDLRDKQKILDIGCGVNAPFLAVIKKYRKKVKYIGIDAIEEIQIKNREIYGNNKFIKFLTLLAPYHFNQFNKKFDLIVASFLFDSLNIPEIYATLIGMHQLLKLGGEMLITLSENKKEIAQMVLSILKGIGYFEVDLNPLNYRYRLKIKSKDKIYYRRFFIIKVTKKRDLDLKDLLNYYLAVSYFRAGKLKKAERYLEKISFAKSFLDLAQENIRISNFDYTKPSLFIIDDKIFEDYDRRVKKIERKMKKLEKELIKLEEEINKIKKIEEIKKKMLEKVQNKELREMLHQLSLEELAKIYIFLWLRSRHLEYISLLLNGVILSETRRKELEKIYRILTKYCNCPKVENNLVYSQMKVCIDLISSRFYSSTSNENKIYKNIISILEKSEHRKDKKYIKKIENYLFQMLDKLFNEIEKLSSTN